MACALCKKTLSPVLNILQMTFLHQDPSVYLPRPRSREHHVRHANISNVTPVNQQLGMEVTKQVDCPTQLTSMTIILRFYLYLFYDKYQNDKYDKHSGAIC